MKIKRLIVLIIAVTLFFATTTFTSEKEERPAIAKGKLQVQSEDDTICWVQFNIYKDAEDQPKKGYLLMTSEDKTNKVTVEIRHFAIDDRFAWFAGKCVKDTDDEMKDRWLFAVIHDDGAPGRIVDHIWWQWLEDVPEAENVAIDKIKKLLKPKEKRTIKQGNILIMDN